jgi:nucleoside phosphorylase
VLHFRRRGSDKELRDSINAENGARTRSCLTEIYASCCATGPNAGFDRRQCVVYAADVTDLVANTPDAHAWIGAQRQKYEEEDLRFRGVISSVTWSKNPELDGTPLDSIDPVALVEKHNKILGGDGVTAPSEYKSAPTLEEGEPLQFHDVGPVDIAILTVLTEEHQEMYRALGRGAHLQGPEDKPNRYSWSLHRVPGPGARTYQVILGKTARATTGVAQAAVQKTIQVWNPRYLLWVGVCGGVEDEKELLTLGDVVVATQIWGYEYGKIAHGEVVSRMNFIYPVADDLFVATTTLQDDWKAGLAHSPKLIHAPIASGNKIIDDAESSLFQEIKRKLPGVRAIEMEGAGAAYAVQQVQEGGVPISFGMIRGVSDIPGVRAGTTVRDDWKRGASRAAAALTVELIRKRWPVTPKSHAQQVRPDEEPRNGPFIGAPPTRSGAKQLSLRERNLVLLEAAEGIFPSRSVEDWSSIKRSISGNQVRSLYEVIATLWPVDTRLTNLVTASDKLRALYVGDMQPHILARNIFRFSLYTDEILLVDPFQNPHTSSAEANPLQNPDAFKSDTLKLLLCLKEIAPWIRAGIVTLVPNPGIFDADLRRKVQRIAPTLLTEDMARMDEHEEREYHEWFGRILMSHPESTIVAGLRMYNPRITDRQIRECLADIRELQRTDPLALEQEQTEQFYIKRTGAGIPLSLYLCHIFDAFPYATSQGPWDALRSLESKDEEFFRAPRGSNVWTPLTHSFHGLKFRFLDNVDTSFALGIRQEGRLAGFRDLLREIWKSATSSASERDIRTQALEFQDKVAVAYESAQADWQKIDKDLVDCSGLVAGAGLIAGALDLSFPLAGVGVGLLSQLVGSRMKRRQYRRRVPMSVLVDLSRK